MVSFLLVMAGRMMVFIFLFLIKIWVVHGNQDYVVLKTLHDEWENTPASWGGVDPCRENWVGVGCTNSRVTSIKLGSMNLSGHLTGDVTGLTELLTLDLSYNEGLSGNLPLTIGNLKKLIYLNLVGCSFSGKIPDTIGSMQSLQYLSLNKNNFNGEIPHSIGNLQDLIFLDLADNSLSGQIPVSNGSMSGLDMLMQTKHFHFENNQLQGEIPPKLFSSGMQLIHVLFENNQLNGGIPYTLGLVQNLEIVRFDSNSLEGPVPSNLNNLTSVTDLYLSNNLLTGPLPNLTGMNALSVVDISNNRFDKSAFPTWVSTFQSLTTLVMENTSVQGEVVEFFNLPQLQTVILRNNYLNGTFNTGPDYSSQLHLVDLENNYILNFTKQSGQPFELILVGNPFCNEIKGEEEYCTLQQQASPSLSPPLDFCTSTVCNPDQTSSPDCRCGYPYTGRLVFRAPSFSNLKNSSFLTSLQFTLMSSFKQFQLPVDSVSVSNPTINFENNLVIDLEMFPYGQDQFNRTGIYGIAFMFSNQEYSQPPGFGPYDFSPDNYGFFAKDISSKPQHSSGRGIVIGAAVGGCVVVLLLLAAGIYACQQKKIAERATQQRNPFASWDPKTSSGGVPILKGSQSFSFEDLKKCTNNFSDMYTIGSGGYGKVYRGILPSGLMVAIKRAEQKSLQGGLEFKTEIELLSRVHHKNVVSLVGFCFEQGEQILVYEYIPNGTLKDSLSGKSGIRLDWIRRLRIALGAAKGIQYLHDLANPPVIHRDIKSNNIILDEHLNAKVSDFGLSKPMGGPGRGHVTTQVKGTMGYLDPEYYMTQQLTEKSDVYSFGVLLLELITAKMPIENGKYIVREVKLAIDRSKDAYNLQGILDPALGLSSSTIGLEKFVDVALRCVKESGSERPRMIEVVKQIESIMQLAGLDPNIVDSASNSAYAETSTATDHPYSDKSLFIYSATYQTPKLEPK